MKNLIWEYMQKNDVVLQTQATSIRNVEVQLEQLVSDFSERMRQSLPSSTEMPNQVDESRKD